MIKTLPLKFKFGYLLIINLLVAFAAVAQQPVIATHPRLFIDADAKARMMAKKATNDADWKAVFAQANKYTTGTVIPWNDVSVSDAQYYGTNDIFYSYCGSSWEEAAMTLALAHQLTKTSNAGANPTAYSDKMVQFADVIIQAYATYPPNADNQFNIFQYNVSYATRHVGKTIAVLYDMAYDELGETRRAAMRHVMTDWFTYMCSGPNTVFQLDYQPTGNYYAGQMICAGYMGLAIAGEDPLADKMIQFARQRLTGDPGSLNTDLLNSGESSANYFTQSIKGGLPTYATLSYLGPAGRVGSPQRDGLQNQGWIYGGETIQYLVDYITAVRTATGENLLQTDTCLNRFFKKTSVALVHAYTPNHFQTDNGNDYGSFIGAVAEYGLPLRLTALLEGTPEGANMEYFYKNQLKPVNLLSGDTGYELLAWEKLYYDKTRPQTAFTYPPYYPLPERNVFTTKAQTINSGMHKYYMRKDWSATSTWAAINMGAGAYDGHNHNNAGHFKIIRGDSHDGDDQILVAANEVAETGGNGIDGPSNYSGATSLSNTLFFDDYNDYDIGYQDYVNTEGGQSQYGYDDPTNEEQNDNFTYLRADLTSAYFITWSDPDTSKRTLKYYHRSFLYLRNPDIFVVYDKFEAKNSTNPKGQYNKQIRWHFLTTPTVSGNNITEVFDRSKLFIHTVLPAAVNVNIVNENNNPDNPQGPDVNYLFNTNTWRTEVTVPGNPLKEDILTVLQPGAKTTLTEMATTALQTTQDNMEGSIVTANGSTNVVLFNKSVAKYPAPITQTSYVYTGDLTATHTLCGLDPNQNYAIAYNSSTVTVTESGDGFSKASPSGVLTFKLQATALSNNADLSKLVVSKGAIVPVFAPATTLYTESVANSTSSFTVKPVAADPGATIKVNGVAVVSNTTTPNIYLPAGVDTITTVVTAADGVTTKTYKLAISRATSAEAHLNNITLSSGTVSPVFASAQNIYTAIVGSTITSIQLTPTATDPDEIITVNGTTVASGTPSGDLPIVLGANVLTVKATASNGITTKTYKVTVSKVLNIATLSKLAVIPGAVSPAFTSDGYAYTQAVANSTTSIRVIPTATDGGAVIKVNGLLTSSGSPSASIPLVPGANTITTVVTAPDGVTTKTYTLTVTRASSAEAHLSNLAISNGTLSPVFSSAANTYTATVPSTVTAEQVTATVTDPDATVTVNTVATASGTPSASIPLFTGPNVIMVKVTASNGTTSRNYKITITQSAATATDVHAKATDAITVNPLADADGLYVHPQVSPNGDGINDFLAIDGIAQYPDNKLVITNQSGGLVFQAQGYNNISKVFDGHGIDKKKQPEGTYFYVLQYQVNGQLKTKSGYIELK